MSIRFWIKNNLNEKIVEIWKFQARMKLEIYFSKIGLQIIVLDPIETFFIFHIFRLNRDCITHFSPSCSAQSYRCSSVSVSSLCTRWRSTRFSCAFARTARWTMVSPDLTTCREVSCSLCNLRRRFWNMIRLQTWMMQNQLSEIAFDDKANFRNDVIIFFVVDAYPASPSHQRARFFQVIFNVV